MKKLNLHPEFTTSGTIINNIEKIDNPFLQMLADKGAYVLYSGKEDYWIMTNNTHLLLKITEDAMHLECIATLVDARKKGFGNEMMSILVECSEETGIPITLEVSDVTGNGYMMAQHNVIAIGMRKKDKIPVGSLPKWYEKFGFTKSPSYTAKKKEMIYTPKNK